MKARAHAAPLGGEGFGVLSGDSLRNLKYHLVITVAFITRFCVEGGMERETAYNLSDIYIRAADHAVCADEIHEIHAELIADFTERMRTVHRRSGSSYQVMKCKEYIYDHLHEKISVSGIAAQLGLSVPYVSKLFGAETGMTLNRYILKKRIDAACQMLKYSDYCGAKLPDIMRVCRSVLHLNCSMRSQIKNMRRSGTGLQRGRYASSAVWLLTIRC